MISLDELDRMKNSTEQKLLCDILVELKTINLFNLSHETSMTQEQLYKALELLGKIRGGEYQI